MNKKITESIGKGFFLFCSILSIVSLALITVYIFMRGTPAIGQIGLIPFLTGTKWQPRADIFGILPMILGSVYITLGSVIIGVPVGLLTAVYMAELAPAWANRIIRPSIELLAGIPSVVYGFFGLAVLVPFIYNHIGGEGNSMLAAIIILSIMILPTIITTAETSIRAVPDEYREGAYALGASQIRSIFKVVIPAAKSGIFAGIVLGIGRSIGETMAVILVAGNTVRMPTSILQSVRTLTANCAIEMGYASGLHSDALFATGVVLFVFIMLINLALIGLRRGRV